VRAAFFRRWYCQLTPIVTPITEPANREAAELSEGANSTRPTTTPSIIAAACISDAPPGRRSSSARHQSRYARYPVSTPLIMAAGDRKYSGPGLTGTHTACPSHTAVKCQ
jgi:hypothetical protein